MIVDDDRAEDAEQPELRGLGCRPVARRAGRRASRGGGLCGPLPALLVAPKREPERDDHLRRHRAELRLVDGLRVDSEVDHRVEELDRHARALLDRLDERREVGAAAGDVDRLISCSPLVAR